MPQAQQQDGEMADKTPSEYGDTREDKSVESCTMHERGPDPVVSRGGVSKGNLGGLAMCKRNMRVDVGGFGGFGEAKI